MQESQRRKETMRFFNMLNEPERSQAIANYDEKSLMKNPENISDALYGAFLWGNTKEGAIYWSEICRSIQNNTYNFKNRTYGTNERA